MAPEELAPPPTIESPPTTPPEAADKTESVPDAPPTPEAPADKPPSDPAIDALLDAYAEETGQALDRDTPGVEKLLSQYSSMRGATPDLDNIVLRQLRNITGAAERPPVQTESNTSETGTEGAAAPEAEQTEAAAEEAETPETPEAEPQPISAEDMDRIIDQAKGISELSGINLTTPDFYQLLGIQSGADADTLKAAYRKRMTEVHPDKYGFLGAQADAISKNAEQVQAALQKAGITVSIEELTGATTTAGAAAQMLNIAHEVLSNPESKAIYDWFVENKEVVLPNGMTIMQAYFVLENDNIRSLNMQRWGERMRREDDEKAREDARARKRERDSQQEDVRRIWERNFSRRSQPGATDAPPQEPRYHRSTPFQEDYEFNYTDFVNRRRPGSERFGRTFDQSFNRSSNAFVEEMLRNMDAAELNRFIRDYSDMYHESIRTHRRLVLEFNDDILIYSPRDLLILLHRSLAVHPPLEGLKHLRPDVIDTLDAIDADDANLSNIIDALTDRMAQIADSTNIDELLAIPQYQQMLLVLIQIKTQIQLSQVLGLPMPLSEVIALCAQLPRVDLPDHQSLRRMVMMASISEMYKGENIFVDESDFDM